jgi:hypothetical protein
MLTEDANNQEKQVWNELKHYKLFIIFLCKNMYLILYLTMF